VSRVLGRTTERDAFRNSASALTVVEKVNQVALDELMHTQEARLSVRAEELERWGVGSERWPKLMTALVSGCRPPGEPMLCSTTASFWTFPATRSNLSERPVTPGPHLPPGCRWLSAVYWRPRAA